MNPKLSLSLLLLGLALPGCSDSKIPVADGQKLEATASIATEIQAEHRIEALPYVKIEGNIGRVELKLEDPGFDHQALATEITKLSSVQSFEGPLHLVFHHTPAGADAPTIWITYDARTGKPLEE